MFNTTVVGVETNFKNRKEIHPRIVNIKSVNVTNLWDDVSFKRDSHKAIYIDTLEGGKIKAIIHKSISKSIISGYSYKLWWDRTDKNHDRYLEILDFELIEKINQEKG